MVISVVKDVIGVNYFDFGLVCWGREEEPGESLARNVQSFAQSGY